MASEHGGEEMVDAPSRGSLGGVDDLVSFLESASTSDRSAFQKRANVIFECRTCATLFRKADGFMRHVMRCDSSRGSDAEPETDRRSLYSSSAMISSAARVSRVVPLKKQLINGMASTPSSAPTLQQSPAVEKKPEMKMPGVKKVGRPSNAERMNSGKFPVKKAQAAMPTVTAPVVAVAGASETKAAPARVQKRAYTHHLSPKGSPPKIQNTNVDVVVPTKTAKPFDIEKADLGSEIRPSRARKTPKWLEDTFVV